MRRLMNTINTLVGNNAYILGACAYAIVGLGLGICLWSFNLSDPSSFYYSTHAQMIQNSGGICGAYVAGFFYYLFGSVSLLLVPLFLFISYNMLMRRKCVNEWERYVGSILFICVSAALFHLKHIDVPGIFPGGYIGAQLGRFLTQRLDPINVYLCIYTMLFVTSILVLRFSFIGLVHHIVKLLQILSSQRVIQPIYKSVSYTARVFSLPFVWAYTYVRTLYKPETVHSKERSILEFERGIKQAKLQDDTFWQNYIDTDGESLASQEQPEGDEIFGGSVYDNSKELQDVVNYEPEYTQPDPYEVTQDEQESEPSGIPLLFGHKKDRTKTLQQYDLPSLDIFIGNHEERDDPKITQYLQDRAQTLQEKLQRFGVSGIVVSIKRGPVVTLFEYQPDIDCKISKITSLEDDLALALQALSIRIIAPIPGKPLVGFEVSNKHRKNVYFADVVKTEAFTQFDGELPLVLGQDTVGNNVVVDLVKMPHLLIAGSTGSGKSVALNAMLISMLCKLSPDELRLVLIDPKRLEFASYADIAHLLFPIVTHPKKAAPVLKWVVQEMEQRYEKMATNGGRNIHDYNLIMERENGQKLPYIVVVIDELADLMITAGRDIEELIARITQMARAAGIHLMVATQRPSVDVITGLIKVNFPSRMSFRVTSKIDSRTILDCAGADKLLGRGDMLFLDAHGAGLQRLHGAYVSDKEINDVVNHIRMQREVEYLDLNQHIEQIELDADRDEIYIDVLKYLDEIDEVSISLLQRKFKIGYNRSARIIDMLEAEGIISASGNGKTRSVIR